MVDSGPRFARVRAAVKSLLTAFLRAFLASRVQGGREAGPAARNAVDDRFGKKIAIS
jgi:hypothetical protein